MEISDYSLCKSIYLGVDFSFGNVVLFDTKGQIDLQISKNGTDYGEYSFLMNAGFYQDTLIMVQEPYKYIVYDLRGKVIEEIRINDHSPFMNSRKKLFFNNDKVLKYGFIGTDLLSGFKSFYQEVFLFETVGHEAVHNIGYPDGSLYVNGTTVYEEVMPEFDVDYINKKLHVVFPYEEKLYTYSLNNFHLLSVNHIELDFFDDHIRGQKFTNNGAVDAELSDMYRSMNSRIESVFSLADNKQFLVVYSKGVGQEFYKNNIHDNRAVFFERKKYVALFSLDETLRK